MRKFLYLCPEFPPSPATGAIRPARFARALPAQGWTPVVATIRNRRAAVETAPFDAAPAPMPTDPPVALTDLPPAPMRRDRFPEWLPMGGALADQPALVRAGRRALAAQACRAIVLNAPPIAAAIAARRLARECGLPLIVDLRDPWGPCEMRARERPVWTRLIEGRAERALLRDAALVVLNTETAHRDYLAAFPDLPRDRFRWLRNATDRDSLFRADAPPFDVFTLLFSGSFNRHVDAAPLLALARDLTARGIGPDRLRIALTARPALAAAPGDPALALFRVHPRHPQGALGALMQAADMLVLIGQATRQRIPLKFYDYLYSDRPVAAIDPGANAELRGLVEATGMGRVFTPEDTARLADFVAGCLAGGRHPVWPRDPARVAELGVDRAAARFAGWLDEVANRRGGDTAGGGSEIEL